MPVQIYYNQCINNPVIQKIFLTLLLIFAFISCSDEPTKPEEATMIEVKVVDTNLSSVWLYVKIDTAYVGNIINVYRGEKRVKSLWQGEMSKTDTIVKINTYPVEAGATYTFHAAIVEGSDDVFFSKMIDATMLTRRSNEITWQVDTIGIWQTRLNGVWGSSPEDVYVVGAIHTTQREIIYNVMHWDGKEWSFMDYVEGEPLSAFGFAPDDVWLVGNGGSFQALIAHWDGSEWQTWEFAQHDVLTSIWGSSSNNMYAVGLAGLILHYDGSSWQKMESGTTIPLRDIHGIGDKVYVVGGQGSNNEGILLELRDSEWEIVYNDIYPANSLGGYGTTVWCTSLFYTYFYLAPKIKLQFDNSITGGFDSYGVRINKIRGTNYNNIFAVGSYGHIIRYEGKDEQRLAPFYTTPNDSRIGDTMKDVMVFNNAVFVIGYSKGLGTIYRGTF